MDSQDVGHDSKASDGSTLDQVMAWKPPQYLLPPSTRQTVLLSSENGNGINNASSDRDSATGEYDSDNYSLMHFASTDAVLDANAENIDIESPQLDGQTYLNNTLPNEKQAEYEDEDIDIFMPDFDISPSPATTTKATKGQRRTRRRRKALAKNDAEVIHCIICGRPLREPVEVHSVFVKHVKPPIVRHMKRMNNILDFPSHARVCMYDLQRAMQARIDEMMNEDEDETAELQASVMKNLGEFELEPFQKTRTLGQKAADAVARFGGSWGFVIVCISFIAVWAFLNEILENYVGSTWDPYPFILLNFFLSMIASIQAPIIMMSQNRQSEIDHEVNDYVSTIMLRAENLIRHAQAKTDLLVGPTFRRLLEIQEIEVDLIQTLHQQHRRFIHRNTVNDDAQSPDGSGTITPSTAAATWTVETHPDPHARMLLHRYFNIFLEQDQLIFSRAHGDGDNYIGSVENVKLEFREGPGRDRGRLRRITYDLVFPLSVGGTLDDVLSGDGHVSLRNAFDIPQLVMPGRLYSMTVHFANEVVTFQNGDLPPRYLPTFAPKRVDKVAELWKRSVSKISFTYAPPAQVAVVHLTERQVLKRGSIRFFPPLGKTEAKVSTAFLYQGDFVSEDVLQQIVGPRPLPPTWKKIAEVDWASSTVVSSQAGDRTSAAPIQEQQQMEVHLEDLQGPGVFVFTCDEVRASFHGHLASVGREQ
ncbi:hypothetical protein SmJEL517_g01961 [Synchytrium microbalum]|uniref:DUF1003 domain-containing protein n=1 Tax=Synchytrium microbalum TaxID=1806994 RepID=A0A507C7S1_9FUNG|nr:uncharacterized protein SmJEL517_g01961 [Synchytrium microbalum]TPX35652.1 hypothetical protein SmJEL517_g01961 [Synchytrium microbalum]